MSSKKYTGQKQISGLHHKIINQIPAFSNFIELFAGSAQIAKLIDLDGKDLLLIDIDECVIKNLEQEYYNTFFEGGKLYNGRVEFRNIDARHYLKDTNKYRGDYRKGRFIFADPPYHHSTRPNNTQIYTHEMTHEQHVQFLQECLRLNCMCMIVHPVCELYDTMLKDWRKVIVKVRYHRKTSIECLYMNYPEPTILQDYSYLGKDSWDRQRIAKRVVSFTEKFKKMPVLERNKIINELNKLS